MRRSLGLDVLACPRCGGRLTLIALIEDPAVIARVLRHLGLPTDMPEAQPARAPPLHLVGDAPPTEVAGSSTNPPDPACPTRQPARRVPRRLESRLTATPRTGILAKKRNPILEEASVHVPCSKGKIGHKMPREHVSWPCSMITAN